jgi:cytochrome c oxidase subunit 1
MEKWKAKYAFHFSTPPTAAGLPTSPLRYTNYPTGTKDRARQSLTMYKGSISFDTPMLYALGFMGLFTIGGCTGIMLASLGLDIHLTETYFIVAHFHYIMVGGMVSAYMAGLHFWWPKITGRMYPESLGRLAPAILFVGFNITFFPQFILGYLGMPRRYHAYPPEFQVLNVLSTAGASILAVGYLLPATYLIWSLKYGKIAGPNPWRASGLEWQIQSPSPDR